jgi:hypothetical protein
MRGLDPRIHFETVIPGRASSARTRNPEQFTVLDSGSAPKRAHPGMTRRMDGRVKPGHDEKRSTRRGDHLELRT